MGKNVLKILSKEELDDIFNEKSKKVIQYYIERSVILQPESIEGQESLPIQIPKEHIEQWLLQAIGGTPVGAGNYPVDLVKGSCGYDAKMVSCKVKDNGVLKESLSGEVSLAQNFNDEANLDELFNNGQKEEILDIWKKILDKKFKKVKKDYKEINDIYYIFVMRAKDKFYVCGMKVRTKLIENLKVNRATKDSIFIDGYIKEEYGQVKIYKAKKRMELRLYPKQFVDENKVIVFEPQNKIREKNILDMLESDDLKIYNKNLFKTFV